MQVLLINGSPHPKGSTATALATVAQQLEKAGIAVTDIHDIFVTHAHTDHVLGVIWMIRTVAQQMQQGKYEGELRVWGHDKALQVIDWICRMTLPAKIVARLGVGIHLCEVKDGEEFEACGLKLKAFDIFSTKERQFGFRAYLPDGQRLVCLGDEPYNERNRSEVEGADWLLCEAFCLYADRDRFKPYEKHHSTVKDACELAESLGIPNLVLWHTEDSNVAGRERLYKSEGKRYYSGNIYVPDDESLIAL